MTLTSKRLPMVAFALLLCFFCMLMLAQQDRLPHMAFAEDGQAASGGMTVVQFSQTTISVQENESFYVPVWATSWDKKSTKDLAVRIEISDPEIDIVNTKATSARQTLHDMKKAEIIYDAKVNGSRYLTAAKERTAERTFFIRNQIQSTPLCIGGAYRPEITGDRTVTITLLEPDDGKGYTVGLNNTLTITFTEVDEKRPTWSSETKEEWVLANLDWLREKYPAGTHWNHFVGNSNDPDGITNVACQNGRHGDFAEITGRMGIGSTICNTSGYSMYIYYDNQYLLYIDQKEFSFIQCVGYAMSVGRDVFGTLPYNGAGWKTLKSARSWKALEVGDYVRVEGHSFFVIGTQNGQVTVTECNVADDPCIIFWDAKYLVSEDGRTVSRVVSNGIAPAQKIESVIRITK